MTLPKNYQRAMQALLGDEFSAYIESMQQKSQTAIRINTAKVSLEQWEKICPFETEPIPWTEKGFLITDEQCNPAKHPYYYAGLYYIQEPSAMIPASILPVREGDRILDVCAAPGGKATELASKLHGTGQLIANDISVSRAMALAKNLQIAGADNAVVTAESPERLQESFHQYFDSVLIDAPCSGEGMFRRDPHMIQDWEAKGPSYYVPIQRDILKAAHQMLRKGGYLVYSTCTFSPEEDEKNILWFLRKFPDMHVCEVPQKEGFGRGMPDGILLDHSDEQPADGNLSNHSDEQPADGILSNHSDEQPADGNLSDRSDEKSADGSLTATIERAEENLAVTAEERTQLSRCIRIFPHRSVGEGHFAVLLQKENAQTAKQDDRIERQAQVGQGSNYNAKAKKKHSCVSAKQKSAFGKKKNMPQKAEIDLASKAAWWVDRIFGQAIENRTLIPGKKQFVLEMEEPISSAGLRCIQTGLLVGTARKRFEPSIQLALAVRDKDKLPYVDLSSTGQDVLRYLKGETLQDVTVQNEAILKQTDHYVLVCVDGFALGWAKYAQNGMLKNKYYAGWRMQ